MRQTDGCRMKTDSRGPKRNRCAESEEIAHLKLLFSMNGGVEGRVDIEIEIYVIEIGDSVREREMMVKGYKR